jgi:alkylation response protein AidB-like acyl-CoA dehydrogenase
VGAPTLDVVTLSSETDTLRADVRRFLDDAVDHGTFVPRCDAWLGGIDPEFSRALGSRGWLGLTFPQEYGGHGRGPMVRFVVTEELLAAGAPVGAHWIADRQMGPSILRFGDETQKRRFLPGIARGEIFFCIGMSEPDSGSDLASVRTKAEKVAGGFRINGAKIWTSGAQACHAMMSLVRTSPVEEGRRHEGLSQFIIDLESDGVQIRPISSMDGARHFNEVVLQDVFVPDEALLGKLGDGWRQVTSELAYERSGPERIMSTLPLLLAWTAQLRSASEPTSPEIEQAVGRLTARLWVLRQMSLTVAGALEQGRTPDVEAAMVKDLGTRFEKDVADQVRLFAGVEPDVTGDRALQRLLGEALLHLPAFTLRGGTTEILRGIVAKSLERG